MQIERIDASRSTIDTPVAGLNITLSLEIELYTQRARQLV